MPEKYHFMDKKGLKTFAETFFKKVDQMIDNRIVTTIDENSTDDQIPGIDIFIDLTNEDKGE